MNEKKLFLDQYSNKYNPNESRNDFDAFFKPYHAKIILKNLYGNNLLELGCAGGYSTSLIDNGKNKITVVEGSANYIDIAKKSYKFKNVVFVNKLWEEFETKEVFSDVLLVDSLQLIDNKFDILEKVKLFMEKESRLHLIVPNNKSFHRVLGKEMNLIKDYEYKSERDVEVRATQDLDWDSIRSLIKQLDFKIIKEEGILFKLFNNNKMIELDEDLINALFKLGNKFKNNSAHMYLCCKLN